MTNFASAWMFWLAIVLFVGVALAIVLPPLLRRRVRAGTVDRQAANIAIYRDQLMELEADLKSGELNQDQYQSARLEIEKRLSEDVPAQEHAAAAGRGGRWAGYVVAGLLPVAAVSLYLVLGNPGALSVPRAEPAAQDGGQHDAFAMIKGLENKLRENPDNPAGWYMLGRSYAAMERYDEAAQALAKVAELVPGDARILADYADVLAMTQGGRLAGKPQELIKQAMRINDKDEKVLNLAATAAYQNKDFKQAIAYWRKLQAVMPADSEYAQEIAASIAEAEKAAKFSGLANLSAPPAEPVAPQGGQSAPATATAVSGTVSISKQLASRLSPSDKIFIYAQPAQGSKMPLAILTIEPGQLPYRFTLDDSMAMAGSKLSNHAEVLVLARVSKSGQAMPQSGDLQGKAGPVKLGQKNVAVEIDALVP
jgi:cytochrome c-type biogenesis protein CcmH